MNQRIYRRVFSVPSCGHLYYEKSTTGPQSRRRFQSEDERVHHLTEMSWKFLERQLQEIPASLRRFDTAGMNIHRLVHLMLTREDYLKGTQPLSSDK